MGLVPLSVGCAVFPGVLVLTGLSVACVPCFPPATLGAPGKVPHVQPQGIALLPASPSLHCVYVAWPILVLAAGVPTHTSFSYGRAFSCSGLVVLVPVVPICPSLSALAVKELAMDFPLPRILMVSA